MVNKGTLIFFCGKMGAGKSTKAQELSSATDTILLSEDEWLAAIYPEEITDLKDYLKYSSRLKPLLKQHIQNILNTGVSVVMDFPGNTEKQRLWFKSIIAEGDFPHKLIYLKANDTLCLQQIEQRRNSHPERAKFDTEEVFHQVTRHFQEPSDSEGFTIQVISR